MNTSKKPTKRHIKRLERMVRMLDEREARMRQQWGLRKAGTSRSSDVRDAEAIRAALVYIAGDAA